MVRVVHRVECGECFEECCCSFKTSRVVVFGYWWSEEFEKLNGVLCNVSLRDSFLVCAPRYRPECERGSFWSCWRAACGVFVREHVVRFRPFFLE